MFCFCTNDCPLLRQFARLNQQLPKFEGEYNQPVRRLAMSFTYELVAPSPLFKLELSTDPEL